MDDVAENGKSPCCTGPRSGGKPRPVTRVEPHSSNEILRASLIMTLFGNTERKRGDRGFSLRIFRKREASDGHSKSDNRRVRAADRDVIGFRPMALFGAGIVIAMLFFAREVFIPLSLGILLSFLLAIPCTF